LVVKGDLTNNHIVKLKEEMNTLPMLDAFVDDDSSLNVEIRIFARNMKGEIIKVIDFFHS
jgi:hypothetical protein